MTPAPVESATGPTPTGRIWKSGTLGNEPRPAPPGGGSDERNPLCPKENDPVTTTEA